MCRSVVKRRIKVECTELILKKATKTIDIRRIKSSWKRKVI